ncbi:hypothetical protein REPUB_Repub09cG0018600 [Reevesia pubescens]
MSKSVIEMPPKGGFSFDLCKRNEMLANKGVNPPSFRKMGTTIVGLIFQTFAAYLSLFALHKTTEGPIVCDKNCEKIHYMAPNIYCCGAGTAADTEAVTATKAMFQLLWYLVVLMSLDLICILYTPHGSTDTLPFATMGSGSLAAMSVFESKYREGLTRDEGIALITEAICSGIFNDLGSGSNVDICVITKGGKEYLMNHLQPNPRTYISSKGYSFPKKTEVLLTKITPLKEKVEVVEGGDAMEE